MATSQSTSRSKQVQERLRALPAVATLLESPQLAEMQEIHGRDLVVRAIRQVIDEARVNIIAGEAAHVGEEVAALRVAALAQSTLRSVLNATGVVVHTNLGRAPLAQRALQECLDLAGGYSSLEYDLDAGKRGSRHSHAKDILIELTGAEDAAVVNNNAAAVLLALSALAQGKEVVVSRGELVEIGGGFRIPDVMAQSGARLVEVGTTNRTGLQDYAQAITPETALLLKVHRSNFDVVGFTAEVPLEDLAKLAHKNHLALMYDAGSGSLQQLQNLPRESPVSRFVDQGVDLVTFSGDKLLGGPQAGLLVGRAALLERIKRHPLMRAVRPDKLCFSALQSTLSLWRDGGLKIPVVQMIESSPQDLKERAYAMVQRINDGQQRAQAIAASCVDRVGGGTSPLVELEGWAVRVTGVPADQLCRVLRRCEPPVVARIEEESTWFHLRTVPAKLDAEFGQAVVLALRDMEPQNES